MRPLPAQAQTEKASPGGFFFGAEQPMARTLIPGHNAIAPPIVPLRDPALSLVALSGIDPAEPAMGEVPFVMNNTAFTATEVLSGWRIGFAERYVRGVYYEPVEHSAALLRAFHILRQAGAQLVPVDARREDPTLQFTLQRNEIDDLVIKHRLDALVSDGQSAAFHG
jgi:Asp-tRNA(Asn)/Glu-tRNA(Gln) amidotransferase A subunit family amidase